MQTFFFPFFATKTTVKIKQDINRFEILRYGT